ncbi:Tryptophan synthase alpha chain [Labilithrix luteola]|uniref:Tryptophan synthase alpha chain n=1 Tax=Labilithrix luteola TaxID=1391654 RepID=A0A0K1PPC3_9BACT|nr:Tryptophan synthase alpha chain [Labilithrix luteola]
MPASAADGVKNGTETDVDCGGAGAGVPRCDDNKNCLDGSDCKSVVCKSGKCAAATSSDGVKNGDESDKDCGGTTTHAPACVDGKACNAGADCESKVCTLNVCQVPTHNDGVQNGDETGKDCGGPTSQKLCTDGDGCETGQGARDCASFVCENNKCKAATHTDGVKNGDETGKDCGGPTAPRCADGESCENGQGARDCTSFVCTNNVCQVPTHTDGVKNGDETGKDCGGPTSNVRCADGDGCENGQGARDCTSFVCTNKVCQVPTHTDGVKNGDETGKDCGGPTAPNKCAAGEGCENGQGARDCTSFVCTNTVCQVPNDHDNVKNGTETDVDCGGEPANKRCTATRVCAVASDCNSKGCYNSKCTWGRSCTMHHGGDTCGTGDEQWASSAVAESPATSFREGKKYHHDCCESAIVDPDGVPGSADDFRLDVYQITAGRMRTFIKATSGNVRKWVQDARNGLNGESFKDPANATQLPVGNDVYLPTGYLTTETAANTQGQAINNPAPMNVVAHLGGYRFTNEPGGNNGYACNLNDGGFGSRTWRLDDGAQVDFAGEKQHTVSQDRLDQKALVCVDYYMLAAFCAWDGGRLETKTEHAKAWGTALFPWGTSGPTQGFEYSTGDLRYGGNGATDADLIYKVTGGSPGNFVQINLERANAAWNYANYFLRDDARYLENRQAMTRTFTGGDLAAMNTTHDQSYAVSPPGRYPAGAGPWGHRDLIGNAMEITAETNGNTYRWTKNGSFEWYTHWASPTGAGNDGYQFTGLTKYGRATGRCARPIAQP